MLFDLGPERAAKRTSPQSGLTNLDATLLVRPEVISNNWARTRSAQMLAPAQGHHELSHVAPRNFVAGKRPASIIHTARQLPA